MFVKKKNDVKKMNKKESGKNKDVACLCVKNCVSKCSLLF